MKTLAEIDSASHNAKVEKQVSLMGFLKAENPILYKKFNKPYNKPWLWLLRKIMNEREFINCFKNLKADEFKPHSFVAKILRVDYKPIIEVSGEEYLPSLADDPRLIFAANHPLGAIEAVSLIHVLGKHYPSMKFMTNRILSRLPIISECFFYVGIFKRTFRSEAKEMIDIYKNTPAIILFPAGLVARKDEAGVLREREWKKHFIDKALQYKRDIVPTLIDAENSKFFYAFARFRKWLGIKINLEMFLLTRELVHFKKKLPIRFTRPIRYALLKKYISQQPDAVLAKYQVAQMIKTYTESAGKIQLPHEFFD